MLFSILDVDSGGVAMLFIYGGCGDQDDSTL